MTQAEETYCANCRNHSTCDYVKMNRRDLCEPLGYYGEGYEQAIEQAIVWLKANAEDYIVDCTPTYQDAPQNLIIVGKCWEDLKEAIE